MIIFNHRKEVFYEINSTNVSINSLSKRDLLLIIKALEYTNENTSLEDFIDLRNSHSKRTLFFNKTEENDIYRVS